jgi:ABC-type transport system involved in multi-copper enzyme maturation permease subunit
VLSIFYLWVSFFLLPLLCAANAAESVAVDRQNGALRFETLRVGRLELVLGRFLGQVGLATLVSLVAVSAMWILGMGAMGGDNDPLTLGGSLLFLVVPSVVFCTPFISIGICCSLIGKSVVVARVSAIFLSLATWALYIVNLRLDALDHWAADVLSPLLPQYWRSGFWTLSWEAIVSGAVCITFAILVLFGGHMWFRNQDL